MSLCRLTGTGLQECWQGRRKPKAQEKDQARRQKRDDLGLRFTVSLLLPNLPDSRARVILHGHLALSMSA